MLLMDGLVRELRPGTWRCGSLYAMYWTLCRASILYWHARPRQEFEGNGKLCPTVAGTQKLKWVCSFNMVVKLQPENHNHACLAPRRWADLVVSHATLSNGARRSCNFGAPFLFTGRSPDLQIERSATGQIQFDRGVRRPTIFQAPRLATRVNSCGHPPFHRGVRCRHCRSRRIA